MSCEEGQHRWTRRRDGRRCADCGLVEFGDFEAQRPVTLKTYLGDGVYADIENGMVKLTTSDGILDTNTVYLEPEVTIALLGWLVRTDPAARAWLLQAVTRRSDTA